MENRFQKNSCRRQVGCPVGTVNHIVKLTLTPFRNIQNHSAGMKINSIHSAHFIHSKHFNIPFISLNSLYVLIGC